MRRSQDHNFDKRLSRHHSDVISGMHIPWDSSIVSSEGAHYHVWIPRVNTQKERDMLEQFKRAARRHGDPVSFSWDYIPQGACEEYNFRRMTPEEYNKTIFIWHRIENGRLLNGDMLITGMLKPKITKDGGLPCGLNLQESTSP